MLHDAGGQQKLTSCDTHGRSKGYQLSYRQWTLAGGMPKGVVFIVHGELHTTLPLKQRAASASPSPPLCHALHHTE
jgi:hypothetical protein